MPSFPLMKFRIITSGPSPEFSQKLANYPLYIGVPGYLWTYTLTLSRLADGISLEIV